MKPYKNYEESKEKARYSGSEQLPIGGYVCKIINVKYTDNSAEDKSDYITILYDVAEGDYKDFFRKQYDANQAEDKKWKGRCNITVPSDTDPEDKAWIGTQFARWTNAFEDSNAGYHWDWDESKWKDKLVGLIYGEIGTVIEGKHIKFNGQRGVTSVDKIRSGDFKIPDLQARNGYSENTAPKPSGRSGEWLNVPAESPEEIPF